MLCFFSCISFECLKTGFDHQHASIVLRILYEQCIPWRISWNFLNGLDDILVTALCKWLNRATLGLFFPLWPFLKTISNIFSAVSIKLLVLYKWCSSELLRPSKHFSAHLRQHYGKKTRNLRWINILLRLRKVSWLLNNCSVLCIH